jgi:hypothetical protein
MPLTGELVEEVAGGVVSGAPLVLLPPLPPPFRPPLLLPPEFPAWPPLGPLFPPEAWAKSGVPPATAANNAAAQNDKVLIFMEQRRRGGGLCQRNLGGKMRTPSYRKMAAFFVGPNRYTSPSHVGPVAHP